MTKPRKLKSGNWNIQIYDYTDSAGKQHFTSITAPTKQEVTIKAALYQKAHPKRDAKHEMTVGAVVDRYIELSQVLSPTSTTAYKKIRKTAFQGLMDVPVKRLTEESVQMAINFECLRTTERTGKTVSPKTVHNEWGLIAAALKKICNVTFNVTLPKKKRSIKQYPEPEKVIEAIVDCSEMLPCLLAYWQTLSMSEVLGLKCSSLRQGYIYVDQVRVYTDKGWIEKPLAKTSKRNRVVKATPTLQKMVTSTEAYQRYLKTGIDEYLFSGTRSKIYNAWTRTAKKHGLDLSFHDLRHMSASVAIMLGVPDIYEEDRGGWSTNYIMKSTYSHVFSEARLREEAKINSYFEKSLNAEFERRNEKR